MCVTRDVTSVVKILWNKLINQLKPLETRCLGQILCVHGKIFFYVLNNIQNLKNM